jgi:hypothetical protein
MQLGRLITLATGIVAASALVAPAANAAVGFGVDAGAGQTAYADWALGNGQDTFVALGGSRSADVASLQPGAGLQQNGLGIFQATCDTSSDTLVFDEFDSEPAASGFAMSAALTTASLKETMTLDGTETQVPSCANPDFSNPVTTNLGQFPVTVTVSWTGYGKRQPTTGESNFVGDGPLGCVGVGVGAGGDLSRAAHTTASITGTLPLAESVDLTNLGDSVDGLLDTGAGATGLAFGVSC